MFRQFVRSSDHHKLHTYTDDIAKTISTHLGNTKSSYSYQTIHEVRNITGHNAHYKTMPPISLSLSQAIQEDIAPVSLLPIYHKRTSRTGIQEYNLIYSGI